MSKHKNRLSPSGFPSLRGFTLLELIVVIAIIGILAVAIVPNITGALAQGRDSRRISDLNSIRTVLILYGADKGGFPQTDVENILNSYNNTNNLRIYGSASNEDGVHYVCLNDTTRPNENRCNGFHLWTNLERRNNILSSDSNFDSLSSGGINGNTDTCSGNANLQDCVYDVRS